MPNNQVGTESPPQLGPENPTQLGPESQTQLGLESPTQLGPDSSTQLGRESPTQMDPTDIWILKHINKRVRCTYVPQEGASDMCKCGDPRSDHHESGDESGWKTPKTDAYGEMTFSDERTGKASIQAYVRIDHETQMNTVMTLLKKYWKIDPPNVLISVTGGAQDVPTRPSLTNMLSRLVKVAHNTGTWIITGGTQKGVMKLIGEAVRVRVAGDGNKAGLVAIGIATWGCVSGKESLVKHDDGSGPAEYKGKVDTSDSLLDPNHSHFFLVDNGTQHVYGGEIKFRAKLEKKLSEKYTKDALLVLLEQAKCQFADLVRTVVRPVAHQETRPLYAEMSSPAAEAAQVTPLENSTVFTEADRCDGEQQHHLQDERFLDDSNGSIGEAIGCRVMWSTRNVLDAIVSAEIVKLFTDHQLHCR
ncbi:Transient receptor potential cation channel subfamily M member-like 2 [Lamellibrachia satsuma]|nr:Transient receptor potential cation channel subfamily M member-like 2 [Lamellibrachia satsuma]